MADSANTYRGEQKAIWQPPFTPNREVHHVAATEIFRSLTQWSSSYSESESPYLGTAFKKVRPSQSNPYSRWSRAQGRSLSDGKQVLVPTNTCFTPIRHRSRAHPEDIRCLEVITKTCLLRHVVLPACVRSHTMAPRAVRDERQQGLSASRGPGA